MNKRGGVIAESAMVFPMVVLSVAALITMMSYFYMQLGERVDMHIMLRAESGEVCENMFYGNLNDEQYPVYKKTQQLYSEGNMHFRNNGILKKREKKISARKYLIDEAEFVRLTKAAGDVISENE